MIRPSVFLMPQPKTVHLGLYGYSMEWTTNRKPHAEAEPTGQRGRIRTRGRSGNETVAGAASEAFARWLHRRTPSADGISFRRAIPTFRCARRGGHRRQSVKPRSVVYIHGPRAGRDLSALESIIISICHSSATISGRHCSPGMQRARARARPRCLRID